MHSVPLSISELLNNYRKNNLSPREYIDDCRKKIEAFGDKNPAWIYRLNEQELELYLTNLEAANPEDMPLYGVPFAIKDNIDLANIPTTAGCPDFKYVPEKSAFVVEKLISAGAIPMGKTNLDQFATGLVGARSPWGPCHSVFNSGYVSGGSSSGSAVSVAEALVLFSLGTDTAGSGRIPAAFNNLVGLKPSRGILSNTGMVRACRSIDCISVFALTTNDAKLVLETAVGHDDKDEYSRPYLPPPNKEIDNPKVAVPLLEQLEFFDDIEYKKAHLAALDQAKSLGWQLVEYDFSIFFEAAKLLYEGPWVAERDAAYGDFAKNNPDSVLPVIHKIIEPAANISATESFKYQYRMQRLQREAKKLLSEVNFALVPSAPGHYLIEDVLSSPIQLNSQLGTYTNFVNLLDLSAIAIPAGFTDNQMPYGITLIAPAFSDHLLLQQASKWQQQQNLSLGKNLGKLDSKEIAAQRLNATNANWSEVLVCGAHMSGLPLNYQLINLGGRYLQSTKTSDCYKFYALSGGKIKRPGLIRVESNGLSIDVEIWQIPTHNLGIFLEGIPAPLGLGKVELENNSWVTGFICEPYAIETAEDISALGSWRTYLENLVQ